MIIKWKVEDKKWVIGQIQRYFFEERDEEIGELAAENLLEFFSRGLFWRKKYLQRIICIKLFLTRRRVRKKRPKACKRYAKC